MPEPVATKPEFKAWADCRPPDARSVVLLRAKMARFPDITVEWLSEMTLHGMGYAKSQFWPSGLSSWDGYKRTVPDGVEWKPANETGKIRYSVNYIGLGLLSCPFCGKPPEVNSGQWHGRALSLTYHPIFDNQFRVLCCNGLNIRGDLSQIRKIWNTRKAVEEG